MVIDWTVEFDDYLTRLETAADRGEHDSRVRLDLLLAELSYLADLDAAPTTDTATLKRVRQSRTHQLWRVSHPFHPGVALRLIVWFPNSSRVVVALFAGDKARIGDAFYNSVAQRAEAAIATWQHHTNHHRKQKP